MQRSLGVASQAALAAAGLPTASLTAPDTIRAVLCAVAYLVLAAVLGLAFGTLTRSSTGALAIIVTVALLVPALAPGMPGVLGEIAGTYWPTTAGQSSYAATSTGPLTPLSGFAVMAAFTFVTALAAYVTLKSRDA